MKAQGMGPQVGAERRSDTAASSGRSRRSDSNVSLQGEALPRNAAPTSIRLVSAAAGSQFSPHGLRRSVWTSQPS